jgi:hypothetical protein
MSQKFVTIIERTTAVLITLAAIWLHVSFLTHAGGLWRDEVNLLNVSNLSSPVEMSKDSFPILMPAIVRIWSEIGLGGSDLALRSLGFLIGVGLLISLWLSSGITGRKLPLISLALLGLNSTVVIWGDSLRAYGLGSLFIALLIAAAVYYLKGPSLVRAALLAGAALLSVQSLFHNAILVAAVCLGACVVCVRRKDNRAAGGIVLAGAIAAASLLPYLPGFLASRESIAGLRSGLQRLTATPQLMAAIGFPSPAFSYLWMFLSAAIILAGCRQFFLRRGRADIESIGRQDFLLFSAATLAAGLIGYSAFLWFAAVNPQPWYFLPAMTVTAVCFDIARPISPGRIGILAAVLSLWIAMMAFPVARINTLNRLTNVNLLAERLSKEASRDDFVVVTPWLCGISFSHYQKGSPSWTTLPPLEDHRFHRYDLVKSSLEKTNVIQSVLEQVTRTLKSGRTVWIVGWMQIPAPGTKPPPDLAAPPLKHTGWSDNPYTANWTAQLAAFLREHSTDFHLAASSPASEVSSYENLKLFSASGWQTP